MRSPWGLLTTQGRVFLVLGLIAVLAGTQLGYEDVTRVGLLLAALPLVTLLLSLRPAPRLRVSRRPEPSRLSVDERGEVEATFSHTGRFRTTPYLAEEELDLELGERPRFVLPRLAPGEDRTLTYRLRSRHRGAFTLGPVVLRRRDPFGLTFRSLRMSSTEEVLVLPRTWPLGEDRVRGVARGNEGERPQMTALHGEDDVSIRTYRDGDELRRVHWPMTAHRGELMVRQEDRPIRRRVLLVLDSRARAHGGTGVRPSFEWAVSALASVARHLAAQGFVVHLLTEESLRDGTAADPVDPATALERLARVRPREDVRLDRAAAAAATLTSGGVLVVAAVVASDEDDLRDLAAVRQPGGRAMAFLLDPSAWAGGSSGTAGSGATAEPDGPGRLFVDAGWRTSHVTPDTGVPEAWAEVIAGQTVGRAG